MSVRGRAPLAHVLAAITIYPLAATPNCPLAVTVAKPSHAAIVGLTTPSSTNTSGTRTLLLVVRIGWVVGGLVNPVGDD
jgi:hypothetical protein